MTLAGGGVLVEMVKVIAIVVTRTVVRGWGLPLICMSSDSLLPGVVVRVGAEPDTLGSVSCPVL